MTFEKGPILEGEILKGAEEKAETNETKVRNGIWRTVAKASTKIPFLEDVVASYYCAMDPDTPSRVRAILLAALAYFVLPLDSIPDFIIGFGFTDDMAVLGAVIASIRGNITENHTELARSKLASLKEMAENPESDAA
ncbi:MAG: YkvA family protein [Salaquimonas sp.]